MKIMNLKETFTARSTKFFGFIVEAELILSGARVGGQKNKLT